MALTPRDRELETALRDEAGADAIRLRLAVARVERGEVDGLETAAREAGIVPEEILDALLARMDGATGGILTRHPEIDSLAGRIVGRYRLAQILGEGAMGVVYLAYEAIQDEAPAAIRDYHAIKFLRPKFLADPKFLIRFLREARTMEGLSHPGLVTAHEHGQWEGLPFIVMEFVQGQSLHDLIEMNRRLFEWRVMWLAVKILEPLAVLHDAGILHRDLKPQNIIIDPNHGPRIMDFGIVTNLKSVSGRMNKLGTSVIGTSAYLAPEAAGLSDTTTLDTRSDLYSLGCVLYACATGKPPFSGLRGLNLMMAHKRDAPPPITDVGVISAATNNFVMRLLAKNPADRPPSAKVARKMAKQILRALPPPPGRSTTSTAIDDTDADAPPRY